MPTKWVFWIFVCIVLVASPFIYLAYIESKTPVQTQPKDPVQLLYEQPGKHTVESKWAETKGLKTTSGKKSIDEEK